MNMTRIVVNRGKGREKGEGRIEKIGREKGGEIVN
jgi:hypothetical protein